MKKTNPCPFCLGLLQSCLLPLAGLPAAAGPEKEPDSSSEVSEQAASSQIPSEQVSEPFGGENGSEDVQPAGSGDLGAYHVEIKGASLAKDYQGNPAIVITYAWANNSEDTTSAMVSAGTKAFQDGVQLESAVIIGDDSYDSGASMKEVAPEQRSMCSAHMS